jgi:DNA repair exonuclease SbcCD nuclease subunit
MKFDHCIIYDLFLYFVEIDLIYNSFYETIPSNSMEIDMGEKVLLFSDLHLHPHKRSNERLEHCLAALDWVFRTAEERNITHILFGGDLFHDRQKIEVYTYQKTFEVFAKWLVKNKFKIYLLLGNHDLWFNDRTSISSVFPLSALPGVEVISEPIRKQIAGCWWDFIPYTHNPIETLEKLKKQEGKAQYVLGHIALDGAILHGTQHADVAIEHDGDMVRVSSAIFDAYQHVFLGHYHAEQRVTQKVEYIGSPLQLSFGEAFQSKHIIAFDGEKNNKEYIENEFSPKHIVIDLEERDKYNLQGNFVRIKVEDLGSTDLIAVKKELQATSNSASLEIKQQKKIIEEHVIHDAKAILYKGDEMLEKYANQVGHGGLDLKKLIEFGKKICQEKPE